MDGIDRALGIHRAEDPDGTPTTAAMEDLEVGAFLEGAIAAVLVGVEVFLEEEELAVIGKIKERKFSPIIQAIAAAENGSTGEIRVHIAKHWIERDPFARATRLFEHFNMFRTTDRNAVLFYINPRKRKFAIIGDAGIHSVVGQKYWEDLSATLRKELRSTHPENAIALAVLQMGEIFRKYFPKEESSQSKANQLPDLVTEDDNPYTT